MCCASAAAGRGGTRSRRAGPRRSSRPAESADYLAFAAEWERLGRLDDGAFDAEAVAFAVAEPAWRGVLADHPLRSPRVRSLVAEWRATGRVGGRPGA